MSSFNSYTQSFLSKNEDNFSKNDAENLSDSENEDDINPKKRIKTEVLETTKSIQSQSIISNNNGTNTNHGVDKFKRMLEKQGYKDGEGLGKNRQGIAKPIEESKHKGRLGIGFNNGKNNEIVEEWDFSQEEVS